MSESALTDKEFTTLIKLCKKVVWSDKETRRKIQSQKINIIPANFYSDIPLIDDIENSFEYSDSEDGAFSSEKIFDKDKIKNFIKKIICYSEEFDPPMEGDLENPDSFFWKNPAFSFSDAMSYYCMIRYIKPKNILEIGSGFSTLVADQALKKNGNGNLLLIDPFPKKFLKKLATVETIIESFVQNIDVQELVDLVEKSDLWFIDSTHTVKSGSDCLYIYLKVMPEIRKDIIIHSHDVFLPFPYPQANLIDKHTYWTEQYLLFAYMLDNPKIEVLYSSTYANKFLPELNKALMAGKYAGGGGSIWYALNGTSE
ncbi:MAG: class I SAM-dependent methyltransferase [Parcubacteria group bacterium]|nr:class I SAM-dependent methyltransferase [Parcubacteria group bacterium]